MNFLNDSNIIYLSRNVEQSDEWAGSDFAYSTSSNPAVVSSPTLRIYYLSSATGQR